MSVDPLRDSKAIFSWSKWLFVPAIGATGLGTWQLQRMGEKEELIERRRKMLASEPVNLLDLPDEPAEYTPVIATGRFDHRRAFYVGLRIKHIQGRAEAGYNLVVPFRTSDGRAVVLVNRGWVPKAYKEFPEVRARYETNEEVTIKAFVSRSENGPSFAKVYSERQDIWLWVDAEQMCDSIDLPHDTPLLTVLDSRDDFPDIDTLTMEDFRKRLEKQRAEQEKAAAVGEPSTSGRQRTSSLADVQLPIGKSMNDMLRFAVTPEGHLGYAVTWYGIALVAVYMALRARKRARQLMDSIYRAASAQSFNSTAAPPGNPPR